MRRVQCTTCMLGKPQAYCDRWVKNGRLQNLAFYSAHRRKCESYQPDPCAYDFRKPEQAKSPKREARSITNPRTTTEHMDCSVDTYREWIVETVQFPSEKGVAVRFKKDTPLWVKQAVGKYLSIHDSSYVDPAA